MRLIHGPAHYYVCTAVHLVTVFLLACGLFLHPAPSHAAAAKPKVMTAESIFFQLPPTIFDNTNLPVTESEMNQLLDKGTIKDWTVAHNSPDYMYLMPMQDDPSSVEVRIFRATEGGVAVLGARTNDSCAVEMWEFDGFGAIMPHMPPEEPVAGDYLAKDGKLLPGITPGYRLCLEGGRLEAKPMFWDTAGLTTVPTVNRVFYTWNGTDFIKEVTPDTSLPTEIERGTPAPTGPVNATQMQQ